MICALWDTADLESGPVTEVVITITILGNVTNVVCTCIKLVTRQINVEVILLTWLFYITRLESVAREINQRVQQERCPCRYIVQYTQAAQCYFSAMLACYQQIFLCACLRCSFHRISLDFRMIKGSYWWVLWVKEVDVLQMNRVTSLYLGMGMLCGWNKINLTLSCCD